ncbi:hypothetical protein BSZ39_09680 [Bowdeniella nasicola]|uniref:PepSY domain-containing protein n=2 Tax=Bowdeniella nasicola TaxID=208480 RepID=A0A1Q5Q0L8_9ACTO|nr:hypothetical protein BSZ39_09680 [Bowdeniella nasicola]
MRVTTVAAAALLAGSLAACSEMTAGTETTSPAPAETTPAQDTESTTGAAPDDDDAADDGATGDGTGTNDALASGDRLPPAGATAMFTVLTEHPGDLIELDWDTERERWEVVVLSGDKKLEVYTSPAGTEITEVDDSEPAEQKDRDRAAAVQVSVNDAIDKVMAEYPGVLDEAKLDENNGRLAWQIEIDNVKGSTDSVKAYVDVVTNEMWLDD